jgi:primosomal replication protein N
MTECNQVCLTGIINKVYPPLTTPSGVSVTRFIVQHESWQVENQHSRKVKCRIFCVWLGATAPLVGETDPVKVTGFLSMNSQNKLVLHITNIEYLN